MGQVLKFTDISYFRIKCHKKGKDRKLRDIAVCISSGPCVFFRYYHAYLGVDSFYVQDRNKFHSMEFYEIRRKKASVVII